MLVGSEYMRDSTMFTLSQNFSQLNTLVDDMRKNHRATILELVRFFKYKIILINLKKYIFDHNLSYLESLTRHKIILLAKESLKSNIGSWRIFLVPVLLDK